MHVHDRRAESLAVQCPEDLLLTELDDPATADHITLLERRGERRA